jgi:hypothetical protein
MRLILVILFIICGVCSKIPAQQNWAGIPCSKMKDLDAVNKMLIDSLHNDIILYSSYGNTICNTNYKSIFAYSDTGFHDLDKGLNTHAGGFGDGGAIVWDCITYGNRTLFGGGFLSVGSGNNIRYTKSLALWNGLMWDTFPSRVFNNALNWNSGGSFYGFNKWKGKLWMYGGFDTIGNTVTKNLVAFDGNSFIPVPAIPVNNNAPIVKMIEYKNKLIAFGNFYDTPNFNYFRLAQFDGTSWSPVGNGVRGGIANICDMKIYKDTLYIAGSWNKAAGNVSNYIMKWDGAQLMDASFTDTFCGSGNIWNIIPYKNRLYAFGNFQCAANQKAFGVAYYENGRWTVPQDSIGNWAIGSAVLYNDAIFIGGYFKSINGDTTIQKFARLMCPDFDAAKGCLSGVKRRSNKLDLKIYPNPTKDKLHLEFEQNQAIDKITIVNTLGQKVYTLFKPEPKQEIDVSLLPAGIYFLKAENKQDQAVFKVVAE